ncbi:Bifunctional arginine demethylase and lysyl-hydroxylase JMJD6 (Histone arginine demethylase JMJD6) (JmjC domain-containing protein 6) (Jumonji domain-containing protein 6) (Lysyl-hydroxylase JMJD6) (Peptide-lysine 5-dioxygenase JMJD6) (Phosphatidylserine receptor) (Protein PTDSR) (zfpsr) [Durusdinium trenchii]|uniref:JmjC domain-containing protein n=1 Tax=Durusdinium trenchii TaxID=1381693 RepID=A0ABP0QEA1_9DINO
MVVVRAAAVVVVVAVAAAVVVVVVTITDPLSAQVHTDPLGTAAWNAVTHGVKRWVLFEPSTPKRIAPCRIYRPGEDTEAIMYFDFLLPRLKEAYPDVRCYEGLQHPGDLIFVPGDWWHGVLNLEDCVAVTQNY